MKSFLATLVLGSHIVSVGSLLDDTILLQAHRKQGEASSTNASSQGRRHPWTSCDEVKDCGPNDNCKGGEGWQSCSSCQSPYKRSMAVECCYNRDYVTTMCTCWNNCNGPDLCSENDLCNCWNNDQKMTNVTTSGEAMKVQESVALDNQYCCGAGAAMCGNPDGTDYQYQASTTLSWSTSETVTDTLTVSADIIVVEVDNEISLSGTYKSGQKKTTTQTLTLNEACFVKNLNRTKTVYNTCQTLIYNQPVKIHYEDCNGQQHTMPGTLSSETMANNCSCDIVDTAACPS